MPKCFSIKIIFYYHHKTFLYFLYFRAFWSKTHFNNYFSNLSTAFHFWTFINVQNRKLNFRFRIEKVISYIYYFLT